MLYFNGPGFPQTCFHLTGYRPGKSQAGEAKVIAVEAWRPGFSHCNPGENELMVILRLLLQWWALPCGSGKRGRPTRTGLFSRLSLLFNGDNVWLSRVLRSLALMTTPWGRRFGLARARQESASLVRVDEQRRAVSLGPMAVGSTSRATERM